ncbi:protein NLP6-like isoform X2 [Bidens hawaiensis]|uniref:protein NLP6-like isoform X2 n=1 Tax=Bidens hawaiensis TaxID=980011 RepID=UPI00404A3605
MTCSMMLLEQPMVAFAGESRYMTRLWVSGNVEPREELHHSYPSQSLTVDPLYCQEITNKIRAALKLLPLREEHVLVQFWSPRVAGERLLLTTKDQPFGLGVGSEQLCYHRMNSEHKVYLLDKDREQQGLSPPARVFMRGLPEWTSDLTNYKTEDYPQQGCAIRCNLHGYLALPVSDPTRRLRVGVLELLTVSKLEDFTYEVEHIHLELQKVNLTSPQAFEVPDAPASNVSWARMVYILKFYNSSFIACLLYTGFQ